MREGKFAGAPRTQAQLAWNSDSAPGQWTLLNASPDLRAQIEATPELWPRGTRDSAISDVIAPSAEVDQVLGLLLLREFHSFRVHATPSVRKILTEDNSLFGVLARFAGHILGAAQNAAGATTVTLLQTRVPPEMRGRAMSLNTLLIMCVRPLGDFPAGAVIGWLGFRPAVLLGATLVAAALSALFVAHPAARNG